MFEPTAMLLTCTSGCYYRNTDKSSFSLQGLLNVLLVVQYRDTPMFLFPAAAWFPLGWLLAFPAHQSGGLPLAS